MGVGYCIPEDARAELNVLCKRKTNANIFNRTNYGVLNTAQINGRERSIRHIALNKNGVGLLDTPEMNPRKT
jgi:hypothetical protein